MMGEQLHEHKNLKPTPPTSTQKTKNHENYECPKLELEVKNCATRNRYSADAE